ncbi:hypothetical protein BC827DRAFT_1125764 [Russula dissimulans]|nr:hypothetical protein BC827DRAFT_1125764 [Russula dissimulans]
MVLPVDGPVLALSDIMHGIAPGPDTPDPPENDPDKNILGSEGSTPEALDNAEMELMRNRGLELTAKMNTSSREKELLEMVIRLTSARTPDVSQLCTQARTIDELSRQRDFIINEVEEERARWQAERLAFDRLAEALIARRSHGGESTYREEVRSLMSIRHILDVYLKELERQVAILDADNKALRQKVTHLHPVSHCSRSVDSHFVAFRIPREGPVGRGRASSAPSRPSHATIRTHP